MAKKRRRKRTKVEIFRENLRKELDRQEMIFDALAARAGVTNGAISMILAGLRDPKLSTCEKIAKGLRVSLESLLTAS